MICNKCNSEIENVKFCPYCGSDQSILERVTTHGKICKECGSELAVEALFCKKCGSKVEQYNEEKIIQKSVENPTVIRKDNKDEKVVRRSSCASLIKNYAAVMASIIIIVDAFMSKTIASIIDRIFGVPEGIAIILCFVIMGMGSMLPSLILYGLGEAIEHLSNINSKLG